MFQNLCRLCLCKQDLIWIFNCKMADNMKEIIYATSGVEICKTDPITQMVCNTCCQITIKMYKFRTTSIKNDKDLKAQYADYNILQLSQKKVEYPLPLAKKDVTSPLNSIKKLPQITIKNEVKPKVNPIPPKYKFAHPSVKQVVKLYPHIVIPEQCLKSHIGAYITLISDEVDEWFKDRNISDKEIARLKKQALEPTKEKVTQPKKKRRSNELTSVTKKARIEASIKNKSTSQAKNVKGEKVEEIRSPSPTNVLKRKKMISKSSENVKPIAPITDKKRTRTTRNKPSPVEGEIKSEDNKNKSTATKVPNEYKKPSILDNMLPSKNAQDKTTVREEITLKSILQSQKNIGGSSRRKQKFSNLLIDEMEFYQSCLNNNDDDHSTSESPMPEDYELFTSRPFIKDPKTPSECVIVSDAKDDQRESQESRDKTTFTEALNLAPTADITNSPDLSLLSIAKKPCNLYTCKICDSQQYSVKDLKLHMKRRHMYCPFCRKRFNTLTQREEHVSNCSVRTGSIKMKNPKLELVRVDEIEEIRTMYGYALEQHDKEDEQGDSDIVKITEQVECEVVDGTSSLTETDTEKAASELEKLLICSETLEDAKEQQTCNETADVICISDEETENKEIPHCPDTSNRGIKVVNSEILHNIDTHASEWDVLTTILRNKTSIKTLSTTTKTPNTTSKTPNTTTTKSDTVYVLNLEDNPIKNGSSSRVKIFKNLRNYMRRYKIPIEVSYSSSISVEYKTSQAPPERNTSGLWQRMSPIDLKPLACPRNQQSSNKFTVLNGQSRLTSKSNQSNASIIFDNGRRKVIQTPTTNLMLSNIVTSSPIVLNGTPSLYTTATTDLTKYAILVPNNLLPAQQGPLPVIQSVTSLQPLTDQPSAAAVANLESITNSLMPTSNSGGSDLLLPVSSNSNTVIAVTNVVQPSTSVASVQSTTYQPSIRVKNVQELS